MTSIRKSGRLAQAPLRNYHDYLPYPEGEPISQFEKAIAELNKMAFPSSPYAAVDDVLVFSLFASKRKGSHLRSLQPVPSSSVRSITPEEGIAIRNECNAIPRENPTIDDCGRVARRVCMQFPHIIPQSSLPVFSQ
jgi:hypothetical protein